MDAMDDDARQLLTSVAASVGADGPDDPELVDALLYSLSTEFGMESVRVEVDQWMMLVVSDRRSGRTAAVVCDRLVLGLAEVWQRCSEVPGA